MVRRALSEAAGPDCLFVEFNAWLYQGYDDARAALIDVIANALEVETNKRKTAVDKVVELLERVRWLRVAKLVGSSALAIGLGLPPVGILGQLFGIGTDIATGVASEKTVAQMESAGEGIEAATSGLLKPKKYLSPPKEIEGIRTSFEKILAETGIKLVVLIDDLDRCLPSTAISTLEAIRLFLFLNNTAFVIAADDNMIKQAVKRHFEGFDDDIATNYFDKLIQVPIHVPPLGTQEVRAYMMMLFVENSELQQSEKEMIRKSICSRLSQAWKGERVDRLFIESLGLVIPPGLASRLDSAERLAPLMTTASQIAGNPRLIKRFLNALSIRMEVSHAQSVNVDEGVLAKMLLFERCSRPTAYTALVEAINRDDGGKPRFLAEWEESSQTGTTVERGEPWDDDFISEWIAMPPRLADIDLRGVLYVSREHAALITPSDRLTSEAASLLSAIVRNPEMTGELDDRLKLLGSPQLGIMMERLVERASLENEWGVPPVPDALLAIARIDASQVVRLTAFLRHLPPAQIKPSIVPKIGDESWARPIFDHWLTQKVSAPVRRAISQG